MSLAAYGLESDKWLSFARLTTDSLVIETHECESLTELGKHFYPTIAEQFVAVPDDAEPGDTIADGAAVKPAPSPEPEAHQHRTKLSHARVSCLLPRVRSV